MCVCVLCVWSCHLSRLLAAIFLFVFFLKVLFIQRYCLFHGDNGKKARDAISSFGIHATILTRVQSFFSQGDRTERLGLGLGSTRIRLFRLKEVEGKNGYEDFSVMCFWMRNK